MLPRTLIFSSYQNSFSGEKGVITINYIFCGKAWPFDSNFFCGWKQFPNFMLPGNWFFCHQNSFNGEKGLITTNYIFCGIDPNLFVTQNNCLTLCYRENWYFVTKTHLMVKRDLLQQIIYVVVNLSPLIQTFFVTQNNCLTLCYWENWYFLSPKLI